MGIIETIQTCRYMQLYCVLIVTLLEASVGMFATWLSPVLPQLTSPSAPLGVTFNEVEISWLVAAEKLGDVFGCVISAYLSDKIGRKKVLLLAGIPIIISWIIMASFETHPSVLISARVLGGIGSGCSFVVLAIYIGEVAEKDIRGKLTVIQSILGSLGGVFVLIVGPFVGYLALTLMCMVCPVVFVLLFFFMPETPYFLVKKGNIEAAKQNLHKLSQKGISASEINNRLHEIQKTVTHDLVNKTTLWELFRNKTYRKPLFIIFVLRTLLMFSGVFVLNSYLQTIIESSGSNISPEISSIIFGVIQLPSVILAALLVDVIGRRPLLIISSLGCAVTLMAEGTYFYLQDYAYEDVSAISWLPTTSLTLYLVLVYFGIYVIPGVIISELFPINVKTVASMCVSIYGSALGFLIAKFFEPISNEMGKYFIFWLFGSVCFLGSLFGLFVLPETKKKSFLDIQEMLHKKSSNHET